MSAHITASAIYGVICEKSMVEDLIDDDKFMPTNNQIGVFLPSYDHLNKSKNVLVGCRIAESSAKDLESYNYTVGWTEIPEVSNMIDKRVRAYLKKIGYQGEPKLYIMAFRLFSYDGYD